MQSAPLGTAVDPSVRAQTTRVEVSRSLKAILVVLALVLAIFGGWRLLAPIGFYTFNGLLLPAEPGMLSEVRGAGGIMVLSGLIVGLGAFRRAWSRTSVVMAAVLFSSLVLSRLLGLALDGNPGSGVITGLVIESMCAGAAGFAFLRYRD